MTYNTVIVDINTDRKFLNLTIHRPDNNNALNAELLSEINQVLDVAEADDTIRTVVLRGDENYFCAGMDFKEVAQQKEFTREEEKDFAKAYISTLKRFTTSSKSIVSICESKVLAGGIGLVAASDMVIASPKATFGLSEALWGLLPANVMPFLIRRVGFQSAYYLTLMTKAFPAKEVLPMRLVDILSENTDTAFRKLNQRLSILHPKTIKRMKAYFHDMWIINEKMEQLAIDTLADLKMDPMVQDNIKNYINHGKFPWEAE
jgi:polyketide biosynthesis enoyl-CoA hydratase PksH